MEVDETKCPSGYGKPPWIFKGSALYQLHLVKAEIARAIIPKEFRLVEAFGYTLGGFFLAKYDDSPIGSFDELVVIAGIVWNPPTSHAWATRVYVNSAEACSHGKKVFGLPSHVATFSKSIEAMSRRPKREISGFVSSVGFGTNYSSQKNSMDIQVAETNGPAATGLYNISLNSPGSKLNPPEWMAPAIRMSLPSFSGRTEYNPHLLKYSCQIECRVKPTSPAKVLGLSTLEVDGQASAESQSSKLMESSNRETEEGKRNLSKLVMLSKPIIALEFNCLKMRVEPPVIVSKGSDHSLEHGL